jgi:hypothetical protein
VSAPHYGEILRSSSIDTIYNLNSFEDLNNNPTLQKYSISAILKGVDQEKQIISVAFKIKDLQNNIDDYTTSQSVNFSLMLSPAAERRETQSVFDAHNFEFESLTMLD